MKILKLENYHQVLNDIREILEKARYKVYKTVDNLRVQTYWQVGERIVREELRHKERADYGKKLVERLALDLDISIRLLYRSIQFYRAYEILPTVSAELSWSHYDELIKISSNKERQFYETQAIRNCWSIRELRKQIKRGLYKKYKDKDYIKALIPVSVLPISEKVFKTSYDFDFLQLPEKFEEKEVEDALVDKVVEMLMELGKYFCFAGRQYKMLIDKEWHKVDLVFYHRVLHCIILVDLKRGRYKKEYAGQMNTYIEYFRKNEEFPADNPTIGLILCEDIGYEEAVYSLAGLEKKIFLARYKTRLPTENQIKDKLRKIRKTV